MGEGVFHGGVAFRVNVLFDDVLNVSASMCSDSFSQPPPIQ